MNVKRLSISPGDRYGRLIVLAEMPNRTLGNGRSVRVVRFRCDCGTEKDFVLSHVRYGASRSCGCSRVRGGDLREILSYDADTGHFTWRDYRKAGATPGDKAGSLTDNGYIVVIANGERYAAHRLAWFFVHGTWPQDQIDHINGVRTDNRISNLRDVTNSINAQNRRTAKRTSTSGYLGACKSTGGWQARIVVNGEETYLGKFGTPEEAHAAYVQAKRQLHPGGTI